MRLTFVGGLNELAFEPIRQYHSTHHVSRIKQLYGSVIEPNHQTVWLTGKGYEAIYVDMAAA